MALQALTATDFTDTVTITAIAYGIVVTPPPPDSPYSINGTIDLLNFTGVNVDADPEPLSGPDIDAGSDRLIIDYSAVSANIMGGIAERGIGGGIAIGGVEALKFTEFDFVQFYGGSGNDEINALFPWVQVYGGDGDDRLGSISRFTSGVLLSEYYGEGGNDTLGGLRMSDLLSGGTGDDILDIGFEGGHDTALGGAGNDTISARYDAGDPKADTIDGGDGVDKAFLYYETFQGTFGIDFSLASGSLTLPDGTQLSSIEMIDLSAGAGADTLRGTNLSDTISGGDGDDTFFWTGLGSDDLNGQLGVDTLVINLANSASPLVNQNGAWQFADPANPALLKHNGFERYLITLGSGDDNLGHQIALAGTTFLIDGGVGHDTLSGGGDTDTLTGGSGNDRLRLRQGADVGSGDDGDDTLLGEAGEDTLNGGIGADSIDGGEGAADLATFGGAARVIVNLFTGQGFEGEAAGDRYVGIENVRATAFNDIIVGAAAGNLFDGLAGADTLYGNAGNDTLIGGEGADLVFGEADNDLAFGWLGNDVLWGGTGADTLFGEQDNDTLLGEDGNDVLLGDVGNDVLYGWIGNDTLYGWLGDDVLWGEAGTDRLFGEDGADTFIGGLGRDTMTGGQGADRFFNADFEIAAGEVDLITDFDAADRYLFQTGASIQYFSFNAPGYGVGAGIHVAVQGGVFILDVFGATTAQLQAQTQFF
jgi:Ca2+-binding RTX toxin-like protein